MAEHQQVTMAHVGRLVQHNASGTTYRLLSIAPDGVAELAPINGTEVLIRSPVASLRLVPPDIMSRPDWDHYFLGIARAVAARASCRRKKVGAILVDENRVIVGSGYNGAPRGLPDCLTHGCDVRMIDGRESCVRTLHAESNAIDFAQRGANNVTLYSNVVPCRLCALRIIQVGIVRVVYEEMYISQGTNEVPDLFAAAKIPLEQVAL